MKRPDVSKDLTDAKERAKLRKARAKDQKESEADVSEALQQKSSVLVAPDTSGQSVDSVGITAEPQQAAATSSPPTTQISNAPSTTPEKMEVDKNDEKTGVDAKELPSNSASGAETSVRLSGPSGPTPDLASESISPGLAAASLVAVCSSPQVPSQGTPLASVSGAQQSSVTDSKSLSSSSDKDQVVGSCPAERSKVDVESKAPDVKPEGDSTDAKENEKQVSIDRKVTDTCSADANTTANFSSQKPASPGKQPEQPKVTSNMASKPTEGSTQVLASTSSPVSQSATQGTTQVAPSLGICTPSTSSKTTPQVVTKPPSTEPSEKSSQVVSKSTSQGAYTGVLHEPPKGTSRGTSPTGSTIAKQAPSTTSPSSVHPTPSTTTSSSAAQPLKTTTTKPSITSETHRAAPIKTFQHLPAGMTAASSKPFRAITSISSKESSKDTKTDPVKPQEPSTSTKV